MLALRYALAIDTGEDVWVFETDSRAAIDSHPHRAQGTLYVRIGSWPSFCGVVSASGPNGEPLACGYEPGHDGPHSWASQPTFVHVAS